MTFSLGNELEFLPAMTPHYRDRRRETRTHGLDFVKFIGAAQVLKPIKVDDRNERRDFASHDEFSTKRDKTPLVDRSR
jgi:hypothetical protein